CLGCAFDQKVQTDFQVRENAAGHSRAAFRTPRMGLLENQGKCRHMLSGRVDYKMCAHNYNCVKCPYDQMIEDGAMMPALTPAVCDHVSGFSVARDHYYHYGHTWARVEYGGRVRVGIDDFALRLLGPQDEIKLPRLGAAIEQNRPQATMVRGNNEAETLSPLDGTVVAVNPQIAGNSERANTSPYAEGWLMVLQPKNLRKSLKNLLFGVESLAWTDDEATRLTSLLDEEGGYRMAATGGEAVDDIYGAVPEIGWDRLVKTFLT
ncbi:MAG: glycine cleavage system protein H, partial [Deltaproteobacteria bacterium]|nr:glycine cleavage system protein H [Deltaproteobacteria bacterium]